MFCAANVTHLLLLLLLLKMQMKPKEIKNKLRIHKIRYEYVKLWYTNNASFVFVGKSTLQEKIIQQDMGGPRNMDIWSTNIIRYKIQRPSEYIRLNVVITCHLLHGSL